EAACQGLIAGINAALKLQNKSPFILKRNEDRGRLVKGMEGWGAPPRGYVGRGTFMFLTNKFI
ncbi:MAG: hypothetical protein Q8796_02885, partial [Candidatus Phytoplasma australasiaticum]|nr:hypothetical protein [Candidatus Phytoplasma australasiaticum]